MTSFNNKIDPINHNQWEVLNKHPIMAKIKVTAEWPLTVYIGHYLDWNQLDQQAGNQQEQLKRSASQELAQV